MSAVTREEARPRREGRHAAGLGTLLRFALKRDRIALPAWILGITLAVVGTAASYPALYPTAEERLGARLTIDNPGTTALIGASRTKEMILTRRPVEAAQALAWGLVNAVAEPEQLEAEVDRWVTDLAESSPIASALVKQAVDAAAAGAPASTIETIAGGLSIATDDLREGVAAFREKRQAKFPGR